jgi:hypothetical protein
VSRGVRGVDWELTPPPDDGRPEAVVGWIGAAFFLIAFVLGVAVVWPMVLSAVGWR